MALNSLSSGPCLCLFCKEVDFFYSLVLAILNIISVDTSNYDLELCGQSTMLGESAASGKPYFQQYNVAVYLTYSLK